MEIELEFTIKVDGRAATFEYKIEDGEDQFMCDLIQEARKKLCHKMLNKINEVFT